MSTRGRSSSVTDAEVVDAARRVDGPPTAKDVAEHLPIGAERTRSYLDDLVDQGIMDTKTVGSGRVYWFVEN